VVLAAAAPQARAIMAGALPDTPEARIDANTPGSPWAGVGSLRVGNGVYTAVAVDARHVLTAAHTTKGASPGSVRFQLNLGAGGSPQIDAAAIFVHPGFVGFNTPDRQHDIAVVELTQDLPAGVPVYPLHFADVPARTVLTLVGYGASGHGDQGVSVGGSATVKRVGRNAADAFDPDFDGSGRKAVYYFDFDGGTAPNKWGGGTLGNDVETSVAGGDSGSPAFVSVGGQWRVAGVNTFVAVLPDVPVAPSTFGSVGGGNLVWPYEAWIRDVLARPRNDTFANRALLYASQGEIAGTSSGATREPGEPAHAGNAGGRSVWWRWVAPITGRMRVDTAGSAFDTLLAVYTGGSVGALTPVAANDDDGSPGGTSSLVFDAQAGTEYQIAVDGAAGASGSLTLRWGPAGGGPAVENDIPMLPAWAAALLAAGLLSGITCRVRRSGSD
jgi:hypothetical protein